MDSDQETICGDNEDVVFLGHQLPSCSNHDGNIEDFDRGRASSHDNTVEFFDTICDQCISTGSLCGIDRKKRPHAKICDACLASHSRCCIRGKPLCVRALPQAKQPPREVPARAARAVAEKALDATFSESSPAWGADDSSDDDSDSSDSDSDEDGDGGEIKRLKRLPPAHVMLHRLEILLNDLYNPIRSAKRVSASRNTSSRSRRVVYKSALISLEARTRIEAARFGIKLGRQRFKRL